MKESEKDIGFFNIQRYHRHHSHDMGVYLGVFLFLVFFLFFYINGPEKGGTVVAFLSHSVITVWDFFGANYKKSGFVAFSGWVEHSH